MPLYNNIKDQELPALLKASYEESDGDIKKAADTLEALDIMLGVMKARTLINARDRGAKSRFSRGRGMKQILVNIMIKKLTENDTQTVLQQGPQIWRQG